jgi:hypothetical protein
MNDLDLAVIGSSQIASLPQRLGRRNRLRLLCRSWADAT